MHSSTESEQSVTWRQRKGGTSRWSASRRNPQAPTRPLGWSRRGRRRGRRPWCSAVGAEQGGAQGMGMLHQPEAGWTAGRRGRAAPGHQRMQQPRVSSQPAGAHVANQVGNRRHVTGDLLHRPARPGQGARLVRGLEQRGRVGGGQDQGAGGLAGGGVHQIKVHVAKGVAWRGRWLIEKGALRRKRRGRGGATRPWAGTQAPAARWRGGLLAAPTPTASWPHLKQVSRHVCHSHRLVHLAVHARVVPGAHDCRQAHMVRQPGSQRWERSGTALLGSAPHAAGQHAVCWGPAYPPA